MVYDLRDRMLLSTEQCLHDVHSICCREKEREFSDLMHKIVPFSVQTMHGNTGGRRERRYDKIELC